MTAARYGNTSTLVYILQQGGMPDTAELTQLNVAGALNTCDAAKWLRQQGAEWPAVLLYKQNFVAMSWRGSTLDWARSEGCTSKVII
jgi:hypothetical protein